MDNHANEPKFNNHGIAEISLAYHNDILPGDMPQIRCPQHAFDVLYRSWNKEEITLREHFNMLLLDASNRCLGLSNLFTGAMKGVVVDVGMAFVLALKARATGMIIAHNHPSGNLKPSMEDVALTHKFQKVGLFLDIEVMDHLIITPQQTYFSLADENEMMDEQKLKDLFVVP